MYYSNPQVVFQEVPNEISFAISISGCQLNCNGCHSAFTWNKNFGEKLTLEFLEKVLLNYEGLISCFLFYGGEWDFEKLLVFVKYLKTKKIKVCLYTGNEINSININLLKNLDYIKTGPYIKEVGGLDNKSTNQKFYKINNFNTIILEEINFLFWK